MFASQSPALGLTIISDFITVEEEITLLTHVTLLSSKKHKKVPTRNAIYRYGSRVPYFDNIVSPTIPDYFLPVCQQLVAQALLVTVPDSITVNEYYTGQVIKPHIDHIKAGPIITILSLGASATMEFARQDQQFSVELFPRSLAQLRSEIRYDWTHAIAPVPGLRYSLVFRDSASCALT